MNFLCGSLSVTGEIAYFKNFEKVWSMDLNSPKFITKCDNYYYTFSQGEKVTLYCLEKDNDSFKVRSSIEIDDKTVSHLEFSSVHNILFLSCMDSGNYHGVEVKDGIFTKVLFKELLGNKPGKCHQVLLNKAQDKAIIVNIEQNILYFYDLVNQKLTLKDQWQFENIGPRHLLYSTNEEILYMVTEHSNEIMVLDYLNKKIIQTQLIDLNVTPDAKSATLQRNNDSTILYVNVRDNDSITAFTINKDHTLQRIKTISSQGKNAREIKLSNDNKYLLSANINTNNITVFNTTTLELEKTIEFNKALSLMEVL